MKKPHLSYRKIINFVLGGIANILKYGLLVGFFISTGFYLYWGGGILNDTIDHKITIEVGILKFIIIIIPFIILVLNINKLTRNR